MAAQEPNEEFSTKDMALAAFLCTEGITFLRCERVGKGVAAMVFEVSSMLTNFVDEYQAGNAVVEPRAFVSKLAWVRSKLRDASSAGS